MYHTIYYIPYYAIYHQISYNIYNMPYTICQNIYHIPYYVPYILYYTIHIPYTMSYHSIPHTSQLVHTTLIPRLYTLKEVLAESHRPANWAIPRAEVLIVWEPSRCFQGKEQGMGEEGAPGSVGLSPPSHIFSELKVALKMKYLAHLQRCCFWLNVRKSTSPIRTL